MATGGEAPPTDAPSLPNLNILPTPMLNRSNRTNNRSANTQTLRTDSNASFEDFLASTGQHSPDSDIQFNLRPDFNVLLNDMDKRLEHLQLRLAEYNANTGTALQDYRYYTDILDTRINQAATNTAENFTNLRQAVAQINKGHSAPFLLPKLYTGLKLDNVQNFISQYRTYCLFNNFSDAEACTILPYFLKGDAKSWYKELPQRTRDALDLDSLLESLQLKFGSSRLNFVDIQSILNRKQSTEESFESFYTDLKNRFALCNLSAEEKFRHFFLALLPQYKKIVLDKECATLDSAVKAVRKQIEIDLVTGCHDKDNSSVINDLCKALSALTTKNADTGKPNESSTPSVIPAEAARSTVAQVGEQPTQTRCWKCASIYHYARDCPQNTMPNAYNQGYYGPPHFPYRNQYRSQFRPPYRPQYRQYPRLPYRQRAAPLSNSYRPPYNRYTPPGPGPTTRYNPRYDNASRPGINQHIAYTQSHCRNRDPRPQTQHPRRGGRMRRRLPSRQKHLRHITFSPDIESSMVN
jgi:hypothetical protein